MCRGWRRSGITGAVALLLAASAESPEPCVTYSVQPSEMRNGGVLQGGFSANAQDPPQYWMTVLELVVDPYPSGWTLASAKVCVSLSHSATATGSCSDASNAGSLGALQLRFKVVDGGSGMILVNKKGFAETELDGTCFEVGAANAFPATSAAAAAAAPFSGTFQPQADFLADLVAHGVGINEADHGTGTTCSGAPCDTVA